MSRGQPVVKLSHGRAVALMVLVTFLWGTAGVITRHLQQAQAFEITFWRSLFTAASLVVILPLWQGRAVWRGMQREWRVLLASGVCWAIMFTAFMVALVMTSVAHVLITMAAGPLFTALAARLFIGHRLPVRTWWAIAVAAAGIAWMFGQQLGQGHWVGSVVALGVPLAGALNWTLVQRCQQSGHAIDLAPAVLVGAFISACMTLPLAWPFQASGHDVAWLAAMGLGQLAIPCVLAVVTARVLSAPEVSLLALLEVLFGIALAWIGAGEAPTTATWLGGGVVLLALVGNEWWARRTAAH